MRIQNKKIGLIVCADDFGASVEINKAILRLVEMQRISAVSCLATGEAWAQGAALLRDFRGNVDIGLHLIYDAIPFGKAVRRAYAGRIDKRAVVKEFKDQLACFVDHVGGVPDYIDGHQHIHQLPVFRTALLEFISAAGLERTHIRNSAMAVGDILKRKIAIFKNMAIAWPGHSLRRDLRKNGIPTNDDFLGIYDFRSGRNPGDILEEFLTFVETSNSVLVTHPGPDRNRLEEFRYLQSDQYRQMMSRRGISLRRFSFDENGH